VNTANEIAEEGEMFFIGCGAEVEFVYP
jgi:hypothetical protein